MCLACSRVDSSEEWEPLTRRSGAKKQQPDSPSASIPRRCRPRRHPPKPVSTATGGSLATHSLHSSPKPRGRGIPPNDRSNTTLMSNTTLNPTIMSNPLLFPTYPPRTKSGRLPALYASLLPGRRISRPSTYTNKITMKSNPSLYLKIVPKPDPLPTPLHNFLPTFTFSPNSTPIQTSDPTPTDTVSSNSTHASYSTPITTLICMPNQTGLLLGMDTNKITDLLTEKKSLDEK